MTDDKIEVLLMWVTGKSPGGKGFGDKIEVVTESKVTKSRYDCILFMAGTTVQAGGLDTTQRSF